MSNVRKKCPNCNKIYIGDGYKESCTRDCFFKKEYEIQIKESECYNKKHEIKKLRVHEHICKMCNSKFESNRKDTKKCSFGCQLASKRKNQQDKIAEANERWLNSTEKKPNSGQKSYSRLNKESEWRRVWNDDSWTKNYKIYRG